MAKARKFGAFAGVFTPSLLTILGVIMYLRLGWVVGEAGLLMAIAIILVSHVISISTGLSVSSISTDRKVKAGGLYYILSRSLGSSIGGAIGITLFVGTALSIALYLIGFSESFLDYVGLNSGFRINGATIALLETQGYQSVGQMLDPLMDRLYQNESLFVEALKQSFGEGNLSQALEADIKKFSRAATVNDLRIAGTFTLIVVTTIAFISTSFAIRTQFFILAAIVLSLISIFFSPSLSYQGPPPIYPPEDGESFARIFGVFFPAVTGFTAGVAMSGDLKDPKRTIPIGTMLAIGVGLFVYISLALFLAFYVDADSLRGNYNILKEIALSEQMVLAGIWGATISSALGGILGAPRIMQAMSVDSITPKIFGKGVGKSNEPRNALVLTFFIALVGILIGELDAIAEVVSMFYLAAYGFINFACFLESWASSDFRPQFRIPRWISVIGTVSIIIVMAYLNLIAMLGAIVIIGLVFLYLVRKRISLGDSDVWDGVWTSVVRRGIDYLVKRPHLGRNWRPNVILFSGGSEARPYLIDFGKSLIGELGFLSNFQLIEQTEAPTSLSKPQQLITETDSNSVGFFTRRQDCEDIYEGMETIARTYGFSGVDPNTILLGWGSDPKNPLRFVKAVQSMVELDYNILMLNYNRKSGFGNRETIDIWWQLKDEHIQLSLRLIKFFQRSEEWRKSQVRLIIVNEDELNRNRILREASRLLDETRLDVEIRVVNFDPEIHSLNEILRKESNFADLVIMELPEMSPSEEQDFLNRRNNITANLDASLLMVKASSQFRYNGRSTELSLKPDADLQPDFSLKHLIIPAIKAPDKPESRELIIDLKNNWQELIQRFSENYLNRNHIHRKQLIETLRNLTQSLFEEVEESFACGSIEKCLSNIRELHANFLDKAQKLIINFKEDQLLEEKESFAIGNEQLLGGIRRMTDKNPISLELTFQKSELNEIAEHNPAISTWQSQRSWMQWRADRPVKYYLAYRKLLRVQVLAKSHQVMLSLYENLGKGNVEFCLTLQKLLNGLDKTLASLEKQIRIQGQVKETIEDERLQIHKLVKELTNSNDYWYGKYNQTLLYEAHQSLQEISNHIRYLTANQFTRKNGKQIRKIKPLAQQILEIPDIWLHNQTLVSQVLLIDLDSRIYQMRLRYASVQMIEELSQIIKDNVLRVNRNLSEYLENFQAEEVVQGKAPDFRRVRISENESMFQEVTDRYIRLFRSYEKDLPTEVDMISEESLQNLESDQLEEFESRPVSLERFYNYLLQSRFIQPILQYSENLPRKFQSVNNVVQDLSQLLKDKINRYKSLGEGEQESFFHNFNHTIQDRKQQVLAQQEDIITIQKDLADTVEKTLDNTFAQFSPFAISKSLEQFVRIRQSKKTLPWFERINQAMGKASRDTLIGYWFRRSEEKIKGHGLALDQLDSHNRVDRLLNLSDSLNPRSEVWSALPLYYKQLFMHKQNFGAEFWQGREKEVDLADKAIDRFKQRLGGGLLVTGEYNSGRTFFCHYIAEKYFYPQHTFYINPPDEGSINPTTFKRILESVVDLDGDYEDIFDELALNSVFVINDIELWWERSPQGMAVLEQILHLIDEYGDQCLFILNVNIHTYRFINQIRKLDSFFLGLIECRAVGTQELKNIMLYRHRSSPITFDYKGTSENEMTDWQYARLINKYYEHSQGLVGVALQSWISNIDRIEDEVVYIRDPKPINKEVLRQIPDDWKLLLIMLLMHRQMRLERLSRVLGEEEEELLKTLRALKRSSLVREDSFGLYRVNPFLVPHLVWVFREMGLL